MITFALMENHLCSDYQFFQTLYVPGIVPHSLELYDFPNDDAEDHQLL
jgi:hypothetical protein